MSSRVIGKGDNRPVRRFSDELYALPAELWVGGLEGGVVLMERGLGEGLAGTDVDKTVYLLHLLSLEQ